MIATVHDTVRLINLSLHVGAALNEKDVTTILATIDTMAAAMKAAGRDARVTTLVVVDTDNGPNAAQRKRIGEAMKGIDRGYQVLVTRSAAIRAIMTAIRWLSPANEHYQHATCATYEDARAWLVPRSGHPAHVFDAMYAELRAQVGPSARAPA